MVASSGAVPLRFASELTRMPGIRIPISAPGTNVERDRVVERDRPVQS
jgi:hypothetical protein